eukprot:SAG22_NODE_3256_length_1826_cov_1.925304_1_plen_199_part_10
MAAACSLPLNKVIVEMKRGGEAMVLPFHCLFTTFHCALEFVCLSLPTGGGYGGKISNATPVAVAAAFAAHKHRRPVRLVTSIKDCLTSTGKRSPWKFTYRVGCDATGRVTAVTGTVYTAQWRATTDFARCYDIPNWDVSGINCNTDAPRNTWMRSPTELGECTFMNEVMDCVATGLQLPAEQVRALNLKAPDPAPAGSV